MAKKPNPKPKRIRQPRRRILCKFVVTEEERKIFFDLAARRHTTLSELLRQLLFRELELTQPRQVA